MKESELFMIAKITLFHETTIIPLHSVRYRVIFNTEELE